MTEMTEYKKNFDDMNNEQTKKNKNKDEKVYNNFKEKILKYQITLIILFSSLIFLLYHYLLLYSENLDHSLLEYNNLIKNLKNEINMKKNEMDHIETKNLLLNDEITEMKNNYKEMEVTFQKLKEENYTIVMKHEELIKKNRNYTKLHKEIEIKFKNLSNTFHSFFKE